MVRCGLSPSAAGDNIWVLVWSAAYAGFFRKIQQFDELSDSLFAAITIGAALASTSALAFTLFV